MSVRFWIRLISIPLPWFIKHWMLCRFLGFDIHPTARIGFSWLGIQHLKMAEASRIGHFNVFKNLDSVQLGVSSSINRFNLFTCIPTGHPRHYRHLPNRSTKFSLGKHSRVTMRHLFDCNEQICVGDFSTVAGYHSQFLTHSVDLVECRQDAAPIQIGHYTFIGTRTILLGGTIIPDCSVVAAGAVVRGALTETKCLYGGIPAKKIKELPEHTKYWQRTEGWIE